MEKINLNYYDNDGTSKTIEATLKFLSPNLRVELIAFDMDYTVKLKEIDNTFKISAIKETETNISIEALKEAEQFRSENPNASEEIILIKQQSILEKYFSDMPLDIIKQKNEYNKAVAIETDAYKINYLKKIVDTKQLQTLEKEAMAKESFWNNINLNDCEDIINSFRETYFSRKPKN